MTDQFDPYYEWLGISPSHRPPTHYALLGLELRESDRKRISSAADQRVAYLRSMQQGKRAELSQRLLNEVAAAASCLLNPATKQEYDAALPAQSPAPAVSPAAMLAKSALVGPMAPVQTQSVPEPEAPPLTPAAPPQASPAPASEPPPVALPVAAAEPVAPPKADTESDEEPPAVHESARLFKVAIAIMATVIIASGLIAAATLVSLGFQEREEEAEPAVEVVVEPVEDEPPVDEPVVVTQEADGGVRLSPSFAELGEGLELGDVNGDVVVLNWHDPSQAVSWRLRLIKPGVFEAKVTYATLSDADAGALAIEALGRSQQVSLRGSGGLEKFVSETFYVAIPRRGTSTLTLTPAQAADESFISLKSLELTPQR